MKNPDTLIIIPPKLYEALKERLGLNDQHMESLSIVAGHKASANKSRIRRVK